MKTRDYFYKSLFIISASIFLAMTSNGCSIKKMALNMVGDALTGESSSNVFLSDNDPKLVGDALPFAIKMYESLMDANPTHEGLRLQTGSLYIMYANAYIQAPADQLSDDYYEQKDASYKRARNLYLRGRDMVLNLLDNKYPGFLKNLKKKQYQTALKDIKKEDIEALYWAAAGWIAAFSIDPFDMKFGITLPQAEVLMKKALTLDESFKDGAIHDFFILYYGSIPDYMGGSFDKAREHFKKALKFAKGKSASPYLSLASTVSVKEQNIKEFKDLLNKTLKIDADKFPSLRLQNVIYQRQARFMLEHIEDYFVVVNEENQSV